VSDELHLDEPVVVDPELDELADKLRMANVRVRFERLALGPVDDVIAWPMLKRSEQDQWRDIARAVRTVVG
jgi:hypothetical protein